MCPIVVNPDLVLQKTGEPQGPTQSRPAECGRRQAIQTRPDHPEWSLLPEVFQLICARWHQPQIDLFAVRVNKLLQFVSPVHSLPSENRDPYAFPPVAILGKVVAKLWDYPCRRIILIAPGWPNHALVKESGSSVKPDPTVPAQSADSTIQSDFKEESDKSKSSCLAPKASAIKGAKFL